MVWWRRAVAAVMLAPVLSGCVAINADVDLQRDDKVNYTFHVEVKSEVAASELPENTDLCSAYLIGGNWFPDATSSEPTSRDGYVGCRVSGTTTIDKFGGSLLGDANLHVRHEGKEFVFSWRPSLGDDFPSRVDAFEVAVTFPGKVLDHSGHSTVAGTTVTWRNAADLTSAEGLYARGGDSPSLWDTLTRWGLYGAGAVVLLAIVILVLRTRARDRALAAAQGQASEAASLIGDTPQAGESELTGAPDAIPPAPSEPPEPPAERFWAPPVPAARWEVPPPETWAPGVDEPVTGEPRDGAVGQQDVPDSVEPLPPEPGDHPQEPSPWAPPGSRVGPTAGGHSDPRAAE